MPIDRLKVLPTKRLLAYRDRLLSLEQSASSSDLDDREVARLASDLVYFKDDPRWDALYASVRAILADRKHVDRTAGRRARRDA